MSGTNQNTISWQQMLDIFTDEVKEKRNSEFWNKFRSLTTVDDLVEYAYNFSLFRKRISAWLTKNPRVANAKISEHQESSNIPQFPVGYIQDLVTLKNGENPDFPSASGIIELRENKDKGRYVVAKEDIIPGDTLFLEKPFTLVLCDTESTNCDFCCLPLPEEPARCLQCTRINYCSLSCHVEAQKQFHKYECGSRLVQHVGIARLALRVALVAESLGCLAEIPTQKHDSHIKQYSKVMKLLTHLDNMNSDDKLHYTLTSVMLTMDQIRVRDIHGAELKKRFICNFGGRVLHHLAQMVCNGNAITSYVMSSREDTSMIQEQQVRIATAIFPSASMMNHACDPNILTSYVGCTLIARAARPIKTGEEIFNCYGPHFTSSKTPQRREQLMQQYFFHCNCEPCTLPVDFLDSKGIEALLCPQCKGPMDAESKLCLTCKHLLTLDELSKLRNKQKVCADVLYEGEEMVAAGNLAEAEKCALHGLLLQQSSLHPNNRKLAQTYDLLGMLLAKQGNYAASLEYLQKSLSIIEKCHGELSVEVSGVIDTMVDIATEDLVSLQGQDWKKRWMYALELCDRGMNIVDTLLGSWHPRMLSLLTSQRQLQSLQEKFDAKS